MVKDQKLVGRKRQLCLGLPFIVREFNLTDTIQEFHDGANLPAQQAMRRHV
jgi:hypothetical protein